MRGVYILRIQNITHLLFLNQIYPIDVHWFSWLFLDFRRFCLIFIIFHRFILFFMCLHRCSSIFMDLTGSGGLRSENLESRVAADYLLKSFVAADWISFRNLYSVMAGWRPLKLDSWRPGYQQDWRGLEGVAARWQEGIGRNSHTLELEELGGFRPPAQ